MSYDADLLRDLTLLLAKEQRSPPEPLPLDLPMLARKTGVSLIEIKQALENLRDLEFIEGPGRFANTWLFRKLTKRGILFVKAVVDIKRWKEIKKEYENMQ